MNLGDRIRYYRELKNITQKELAELVGSSQEQIARIETGKTSAPKIDTIANIATALGVPISYLLEKNIKKLGEKVKLEDILGMDITDEMKEFLTKENVEYLNLGLELKKQDITPSDIRDIVNFLKTKIK